MRLLPCCAGALRIILHLTHFSDPKICGCLVTRQSRQQQRPLEDGLRRFIISHPVTRHPRQEQAALAEFDTGILVDHPFPDSGSIFQAVGALHVASRTEQIIRRFGRIRRPRHEIQHSLRRCDELCQVTVLGDGFLLEGAHPKAVTGIVGDQVVPLAQGVFMSAQGAQGERPVMERRGIVFRVAPDVAFHSVQRKTVILGKIVHQTAVEVIDRLTVLHQHHQSQIAVVSQGIIGDRILKTGVCLFGHSHLEVCLSG